MTFLHNINTPIECYDLPDKNSWFPTVAFYCCNPPRTTNGSYHSKEFDPISLAITCNTVFLY